MELSYLDQLRLGDIERRQLALPAGPIQELSWHGYAMKQVLGAALGEFVIHAKDDLEFVLKIVREYERCGQL